MPVKTRKEQDGGYITKTPGGVKGRHMTLRNAKAQARLLRAVEHGWKPTRKKAKAIDKAKKMRIKY